MMYVRTFPLGIVVAALVLLAGGSLTPGLAAYAAVMWLVPATVYTLLLRKHPGLVAERLRPTGDRDRHSRLGAMGLLGLHYVLAGHQGGSWEAPGWTQLLGLVVLVLGLSLVGWTLLSNPFASSAVRIQMERGQHVIATGPYVLIRHPMYLGVLLFAVGSPLALGSWWAAFPMLALVPVFVRRTLMEDQMLHAELEGYRAYASRVRWKIVPLVF